MHTLLRADERRIWLLSTVRRKGGLREIVPTGNSGGRVRPVGTPWEGLAWPGGSTVTTVAFEVEG
jgi:hypothetical protein